MAVEIVAEVGECFNGSMETAREMIRVAAEAGCDCVKFQILDMTEVADNDPEYAWFKKIELKEDDIQQLIFWAEEEKIDILFTPVSVRTARMLVELGLKKVKIASSFLRKKELLEYIKDNFDVIYISTGMASLEEVHAIKEFFGEEKTITILHCISEYPTGPLLDARGLKALDENDAHLHMIEILQDEFPGVRIGYSDHTDDVFVPMIASAMGAEVIEKHITLDRKTPIEHFENGEEYMGTDHVLSIEPEQLINMVDLIHRVERCQGDKCWKRSEGEQILIKFLRGRYKER